MSNNNPFSRLGPKSTLEEINRVVLNLRYQALAAEAEDEDNNAPSEILREAEEKPDEEQPDSKEDTGVEEDPSPVLEEKFDILLQSIEQLSDYITKFQNQMDKTSLPNLEQIVGSMNLDYKSAYELTTFYTKGWFSRSFMSLEGKARFAAFLINTVKPYCKSNLETWQMIRDGDPELHLYISYPRDDNWGA